MVGNIRIKLMRIKIKMTEIKIKDQVTKMFERMCQEVVAKRG